jgi:hypothetical protein
MVYRVSCHASEPCRFMEDASATSGQGRRPIVTHRADYFYAFGSLEKSRIPLPPKVPISLGVRGLRESD